MMFHAIKSHGPDVIFDAMTGTCMYEIFFVGGCVDGRCIVRCWRCGRCRGGLVGVVMGFLCLFGWGDGFVDGVFRRKIGGVGLGYDVVGRAVVGGGVGGSDGGNVAFALFVGFFGVFPFRLQPCFFGRGGGAVLVFCVSGRFVSPGSLMAVFCTTPLASSCWSSPAATCHL